RLDGEIVDRGLEHVCGDLHDLLADAPRREDERATGHHHAAARERAAAVRASLGVTLHDRHRVERHPELVGEHPRQRGPMAPSPRTPPVGSLRTVAASCPPPCRIPRRLNVPDPMPVNSVYAATPMPRYLPVDAGRPSPRTRVYSAASSARSRHCLGSPLSTVRPEAVANGSSRTSIRLRRLTSAGSSPARRAIMSTSRSRTNVPSAMPTPRYAPAA